MRELISIIIPVYKVEKYIHQCVDSLLNQTYENLEIILVDDGSPDNCGDICDEYQEKDDRVEVIHKENGGLSDARNAGLELANGQYISFLDSDDWVDEEYIERLYNLMLEYNSDISVCSFFKTYDENAKINKSDRDEDIYEFDNVEALEQLYDQFNTQMVVAWGKLYKRSLFKNIRFPVGKVHEDEFTTHKLLYKADKVVLTTLPLLYYRQRKDSITGEKFKLQNKLDSLAATEEKVDFFQENDLDELTQKVYKRIFFKILKIYRNKERFKDEKQMQQFLNKLSSVKKNLRKYSYDLKFKLFYELFFILPNLMSRVFEVYINRN